MQDFQVVDESWIPDSSADWFSWLEREEQKARNAYLAKPATLIADYRKEKSITRDYEGREILELLQNAADQAREINCAGRVVLELLPEGLIVANTGAKFSVGGVQSLGTAHLSPKWRRKRHLIGNKGLGFRSILNWSNSPIILSGALNLFYSPQLLERILSDLIVSPELNHLIKEESRKTNELILPLLSFPGYTCNGQIETIISSESAAVIFKRCKEWRKNGYDTAIGMPFDRADSYDAAKKQLDLLRPEILLFVKHLGELRFITSDFDDRTWRIEGGDELLIVTENNEPLGMWSIHRKTDIIPDEKLDPDQNGPLDYEMVIAIPDVEREAELKTSPLFSHFPTEIELPLPVVCHLTLELNQSRNHTQQRNSNTYLLEQLAHFLAEVAEIRSESYPDGPNAGFRLLLPLKSYPHDLVREGFPEKVTLAARGRAIIPTLSGIPRVSSDARIIPGANGRWIPASSFPEIAAVTNYKEKEFFTALGVPMLQNAELKSRLVALNSLSVSERALVIAGLLQDGFDRAVHTSSLLLDSIGEQVPDSTQVFLAPSNTRPPDLPEWMSLRFLNDDLRTELMSLLNSSDVRDLQTKLSSFGVLEYSLANLIRRLVAVANRHKRESPDCADKVNEDVRGMVFSLFVTESTTGKRPEFPTTVSLPLPTQAGTNNQTDKVYLGQGYGTNGNIVQALYGSSNLEKLVVAPEKLKLSGSEADIKAFLKWSGVAEWPREEFSDSPDEGFLDHVLAKVPYPAKFEDYFFKNKRMVQNPRLKRVRTVDLLSIILQHSPPAAIIAWLSLDPRIPLWLRPQTDNADLNSRRDADHNWRSYRNPLPSYIRWKIENSSWVPGDSTELLRPRDCVLGQRAIEVLFPRPPKPSSEEMLHFGVSDADLVDGWRRAGVLTSLAELELEDIYVRLSELPDRDPEGRLARSLYRWLLDASDSAMGNGAIARENFIENGRMWGVYQEKSEYYPVKELRYADSEGLPINLLNNLKRVHLPYRLGTDKVERVFGIQAIDRMGIEQSVLSYQLARNLDEEFQKAKPFLYLLRTSQTSQTQHLKTLKNLSLKICSKLTAVIQYEEQEFEFMPPIWGWLIENDILYVRCDPADPLAIANDLLADSIGAAIASIFRIGDGGEFARMFLCNEKDRKTLLRRMRGESADENMEEIIAEFGIVDPTARAAAMPVNQPIENPVLKPEQPEEPEPTKDETRKKPEGDAGSPASALPAGPLNIEPGLHTPVNTPKRQPLRIQKTTGRQKPTVTHKITDGAFCEQKVIEFEESCDPPRFPLLVGHITGTLALGCDILSFSSNGDREAFKSGVDRSLNKVRRFIEVKGRKNESDAIELRGNELNAAVDNKSKYFIYRLFRSGENEYQLSILHDPLEQKEALSSSVYVDLNRATKTLKYTLSGGLVENDTLNL